MQIDLQGIDITGNFPHPLHRIGVEQHAVLPRHGPDGRQRTNGADFAVDVHHRNENGVWRDGRRMSSGSTRPVRSTGT